MTAGYSDSFFLFTSLPVNPGNARSPKENLWGFLQQAGCSLSRPAKIVGGQQDIFYCKQQHHYCVVFLYPEGGSQKATLVVVLVVISSQKIPKAFLIRSGVQRNFAYTFMLTFPTDLPSQIFHLFF